MPRQKRRCPAKTKPEIYAEEAKRSVVCPDIPSIAALLRSLHLVPVRSGVTALEGTSTPRPF